MKRWGVCNLTLRRRELAGLLTRCKGVGQRPVNYAMSEVLRLEDARPEVLRRLKVLRKKARLRFARPTPSPRPRLALPLVGAKVCAGFPSPADDHLEGEFDLNDLLITNTPATFLVRASGLSMKVDRIYDGDLLLVNRALEARDGHIVVACLDGEFTCKRLRREHGRVWLQPSNDDFPDIEISPEHDFQVWGVVTAKITQFRV